MVIVSPVHLNNNNDHSSEGAHGGDTKKYYGHSKDTEMVCETVVPYRWSGMDDRLVFKMETIKTFLNNKSLTFISSDTQNDSEMLIS